MYYFALISKFSAITAIIIASVAVFRTGRIDFSFSIPVIRYLTSAPVVASVLERSPFALHLLVAAPASVIAFEAILGIIRLRWPTIPNLRAVLHNLCAWIRCAGQVVTEGRNGCAFHKYLVTVSAKCMGFVAVAIASRLHAPTHYGSARVVAFLSKCEDSSRPIFHPERSRGSCRLHESQARQFDVAAAPVDGRVIIA